jgi:hypothetical protein
MDMSRYKKMFVEEAREHLEAAGQHLVALEKTPCDEALINELFRNAHSIKGMAASLGYEAITDLAHTLEDFLMPTASRGWPPRSGTKPSPISRTPSKTSSIFAGVASSPSIPRRSTSCSGGSISWRG